MEVESKPNNTKKRVKFGHDEEMDDEHDYKATSKVVNKRSNPRRLTGPAPPQAA
jgi:hypothetical protein